ncbi:MAG: ATP-binding cassette, subfamily er 3, partial [Candidatus Eremiobacteraeota bacterium]|nr:ATP-binding cassette, subfamily er 3 [Candidatus Eremiobacteraeota bacterium]
WLERGEHVALVGGNGTGKTTLISTLVGERELPAGKLRKGHNVQLGYLSQHADELSGDGNVLDAAQRATKLTPGKARALLGQFLFSGDDALKPLRGLSGGERQRLSLAILVHSGSNVLILDEPTNHLDLDSREALEDALRGFGGSLILVSHDRALLDAVGSRTVSIEDGALRNYEGGWADFVRERDERRAAEAAAAGKKVAKDPRPKKSKPMKSANGGPSKNAKRAMKDLEKDIEKAERALARLEEELADPAAWEGGERAADSAKRHEEAKRRVDELVERWSNSVAG